LHNTIGTLKSNNHKNNNKKDRATISMGKGANYVLQISFLLQQRNINATCSSAKLKGCILYIFIFPLKLFIKPCLNLPYSTVTNHDV
jgi:hypothetical protein